jgi:hypothetical protein
MLINTAHVQHIVQNTVTPSYRNSKPLIQSGVQISLSLLTTSRTRTFASFVNVDEDHYAVDRQH